MNNKLRLISKASLIASLVLFGCTEDEGDDTGAGSATDATTSTSGDSMSSAGSMTSAGTSSSTTSDMSTSGTTTTTTTTGDPVPNGEMCTVDADCMSEQCYVVQILGGICGECTEDADCEEWGCSIPNPLANPPQGSECGDGQLGSGCQTDAACDGLSCATILDVPGVLTAATCSDCVEDADCTDGDVCNPTYDVAGLSGSKSCVVPGSVGDGEGCDFEAQNGACTNFCAGADVMGVLTLGVCSECAEDTDCADGEVCEDPQVDLTEGALVAGTCVAGA